MSYVFVMSRENLLFAYAKTGEDHLHGNRTANLARPGTPA